MEHVRTVDQSEFRMLVSISETPVRYSTRSCTTFPPDALRRQDEFVWAVNECRGLSRTHRIFAVDDGTFHSCDEGKRLIIFMNITWLDPTSYIYQHIDSPFTTLIGLCCRQSWDMPCQFIGHIEKYVSASQVIRTEKFSPVMNRTIVENHPYSKIWDHFLTFKY